MWPNDLAAHLHDRLIAANDPRIQSVDRLTDVDDSPVPDGLRITDSTGNRWYVGINTTSPPGGGASQTSWD